jgi:hypothetical protein
MTKAYPLLTYEPGTEHSAVRRELEQQEAENARRLEEEKEEQV